MSKDIIVLTPNGRRQKIHCTPDTSMLQVLEDVCKKQGFQPTEYALKHHNHILDLSTTIRFSNLPNKATLEMVEADRRREETNVTVGLLLEDGERRTAEFSPNTSLYDLVTLLAPTEFLTLQNPTILYMRQEVTGEPALRDKTLRQLGLIGGRAILRLLNKAEEAKQANVSAIYRRPHSEKQNEETTKTIKELSVIHSDENPTPGPSNERKNMVYEAFDPIKLIKEEKKNPPTHEKPDVPKDGAAVKSDQIHDSPKEVPMEIDQSQPNTKSNTSLMAQEDLERRLRIEEEVTFLGAQKAVVFMQPENTEEEYEDLPDDFYELTIDEVRKLYKDLQQHRLELENTPLLTSSTRENLGKQTSQQRLSSYKNVVVRIQFPDHFILQGIFSPNNTIEDVINFIKDHLQNPNKPFHIFTTPLKETLDPKMTLLEAKFVPCVHMHFKLLEDDASRTCLKEEVYSKKTSSDAASILASKYRAPTRRKMEDVSESSQKSNEGSTSTACNSKLPKWFKK